MTVPEVAAGVEGGGGDGARGAASAIVAAAQLTRQSTPRSSTERVAPGISS